MVTIIGAGVIAICDKVKGEVGFLMRLSWVRRLASISMVAGVNSAKGHIRCFLRLIGEAEQAYQHTLNLLVEHRHGESKESFMEIPIRLNRLHI